MNNLLIIGPEYRNHRGGVGAVIFEYMDMFPEAKFYCSYKPFGKIRRVLYSLLKMLWFPFFMIFNSNISIVHIHGASRGSFFRKWFYFIISKKCFGKKVIYHIHGAEYHLFVEESSSFIKRRIETVINQADLIIVLSDWWKNYFESNFPNGSFKRVYNPIKVAKVERENIIGSLMKFLFLGHISKRKGCFEIIEVAKELRDIGMNNFQVQIGGNGEIDKLESLIKEHELGDNIKFLGWVSGEQKAELFFESHVFLLPSHNEGLPVSILEAMAHSLPVISTKVGGIPEMIVEGGSGFLINPGDLENLIQKMEFFINNREKAFEMGNLSKAIVEEKFSSQRIQSQLLKVYNEIVNT